MQVDRSLDSSRFQTTDRVRASVMDRDDRRNGGGSNPVRRLESAALDHAAGRDEEQDSGAQSACLTSKTLLITGGTGTFGNAVLTRFLDTDIAEIRVFSRDEKKQEDMRLAYNNPEAEVLHRRRSRLRQRGVGARQASITCFTPPRSSRCPSCEFYPLEALRTNALGAENVLRASMDRGVERAIVLSTDKSVYPDQRDGHVQGDHGEADGGQGAAGTGRAARSCAAPATAMSWPRAVPSSRCSSSRSKTGQPLTVTDPNMTRFMMSIEDAVDLVLFAYQHGAPGDIFVQKAPAATIGTLALAIKELFEAPNPIRVIGTRHGEKLFETLLTREEKVKAEDMGSYFRVPADNRDLNYNVYFAEGRETLSHEEDYHSHNTAAARRRMA